MNPISHICAFSRGALNVRFTRSHLTLAPRPQIWLMGFTGFCAVAGANEQNSGRRFEVKSRKLLFSPQTPQPLFNSNKISPKTAHEAKQSPIFVASEQGLDTSG